MMLTIYGLPPKTKYHEVKTLIRQECNLVNLNFILDNLMEDGVNSKKIRLGLGNDSDMYSIIKSLDGFRMSATHILKVVPVEKMKQFQYDSHSKSEQNQSRNEYPNQRADYQNHSLKDYNQQGTSSGIMRQYPEPRLNLPESKGFGSSHLDLASNSQLNSGYTLQARSDFQHGRSDGPIFQARSDFRDIQSQHDSDSKFQGRSDDYMGRDTTFGSNSMDTHRRPNLGMQRAQGSGHHSSRIEVLQDRQVTRTSQGIPDRLALSDSGRSQQWAANNISLPPFKDVTSPAQGNFNMQQNMNSGFNQQAGLIKGSFSQTRPLDPSIGFTTNDHGNQQKLYEKSYDDRGFPIDKRTDTKPHMMQDYDSRQPFGPRGGRDTSPGRNFQNKSYPITDRPHTMMDRERSPRRFSPGRHIVPSETHSIALNRRQMSPGRQIPLGHRQMSPGRRQISPTRRQMSPTRRQMSPTRRQMSPTRRLMSPGRRQMSPTRRLMSPTRRLISPSRRQISPTRRLMSPGHRQISPGRRPLSPGGRVMSPSRRVMSLTQHLASPNRRPLSPTRRPLSPNRRPLSPTRRPLSPNRRPLSPTRRPLSPTRRPLSPDRRPLSPKRRPLSPTRRALSPTRRPLSPNRRPLSPTRRPLSPDRRPLSPDRRPLSPDRRPLSPDRRPSSPKRRLLSPNRRPLSPVRRPMSPRRQQMMPSLRDEARRLSPSDRRMAVTREDTARHYSPIKQMSPMRRIDVETQRSRFSPRRVIGTPDKFKEDKAKSIRPAYEPQAQGQYGGYRAGADSGPYGTRQESGPARDLERSPRASRRSWARERRRSPAAPPPPAWPARPERPERAERPLWERHEPPERPDRPSRPDNPDRAERPERPAARASRWEDSGRGDERRDRSPAPLDLKPFQNDIDRDFQDVYERALQFRKRTEELRKMSGDKRRGDCPTGRDRERDRDWDRDWNRNWDGSGERAPEHGAARPEPDKCEGQIRERKKIFLPHAIRAKRDKAGEEIVNKIMEKYDLKAEARNRVAEELKLIVANILYDMFADRDVSFIELVIKYQAKYSERHEEKMIMDVIANMPASYRTGFKRKHQGQSDIPAKVSRFAPESKSKEGKNRFGEPRKAINIQSLSKSEQAPEMVPAPVFVSTFQEIPKEQAFKPVPLKQLKHSQQSQLEQSSLNESNMSQLEQLQNNQLQQLQLQLQQSQLHQYHQQQEFPLHQIQATQQALLQTQFQPMLQTVGLPGQLDPTQIQTELYQSALQPYVQPALDPPPQDFDQNDNSYRLYLCRDDFEPFTSIHAEAMKTFLVTKIIQSENNVGWAPDLTIKGVYNRFRYEVTTTDVSSKNWLINLDFSDYDYANILVYTKEELWYERAAIWLPGHSRCKIPPFQKLSLQNRRLENVNVSRWKFVKKIVTAKGTRLYVDMPPSDARALESSKITLSYELTKVSVFLKNVAVDKDAFDAGLKEPSIVDPSEIASAVQNSPMPSLNVNHETEVVKLSLNGTKSMTLEQARKIKEIVVYNLFKYHEQGGNLKTDFLKYGFCPPKYFGIVPENKETKRWVLGRQFGKLNRQTIVVHGGEENYFIMYANIPNEHHQNKALMIERLKQSNQGIKGLNFHLWKVLTFAPRQQRRGFLVVLEIDMQSLQTLAKYNYQLDYVTSSSTETIQLKSDYSISKMEDEIKKFKSEQMDSYDVANMELDSNSDEDDVVCLS